IDCRLAWQQPARKATWCLPFARHWLLPHFFAKGFHLPAIIPSDALLCPSPSRFPPTWSCFNYGFTKYAAEFIIQFDGGRLVLNGADRNAQLPALFKWDERIRCWRARAIDYRQIITEMTRRRLPHRDEARDYLEFNFRSKLDIEPRPYQQEALNA